MNKEYLQKLRDTEARRCREVARLEKWSDRVIHELERLLHSNRWRLGCWLSLKRADDESKEARRLAELLASRPVLSTEPIAFAAEPETKPTAVPKPVQVKQIPSGERPTAFKRKAQLQHVQGAAHRNAKAMGQFISVIIPVYNAYDDLVRCLASVQKHSRRDQPVIVLDDASTDERVWPLLQEWQVKSRNFRAHRNEANLGYTATVNLGCDLTGPGDVILLNSDTVVSAHWIEQLGACAYSRSGVATVTAISNAAGAFSVPRKNALNSLPAGWSVSEMARFVEQTSKRLRPIVPTGNGFCMYLTAAARAAVGKFDEVSFPDGYGEENDFCMRAAAAGLLNLIDDATYVFHSRSASFGSRKEEILKSSRATLDRLHPDYTQRVLAWSQNDSLDAVRVEMEELLGSGMAGRVIDVLPNESRASLLYVLHDGTGGTRFTSADLCQAVSQRYRTYVLLAALTHWTLCEYAETGICPVRRYAFSRPWQVDRPLAAEQLEVLREVCAEYGMKLAHVRHLLGSGPELLKVLHELKVPIVFSFHDFYTVCPTIQLLDEKRAYCAGICTSGAGDCPLPSNWFRPPLPWLKHRYVHEHQRVMADALILCDAWITTSAATRGVITAHFPALDNERFTIIEHGRDLERLELARAPVAGEPIRAVFFGDLTPAKGLQLIIDLIAENQRAGQPVELHLLGRKVGNFEPEEHGIRYHGPYDRGELAERLQAIGASVSLIPSPWPETYCHVLTESWAMGIPVLASDIGTLRERILKNGGGWLLPLDDAARWLAKLRELSEDPESYAHGLETIRQIELPDIAQMAYQYELVYDRLLEESKQQPSKMLVR